MRPAGLFAIAPFLREERQQHIYRYLIAFSLTPWLALHLFYIMILYGFEWMNGNGFEMAALPVSEAVFGHLSWIVQVSKMLMLPTYFYWAYLLIKGKSHLPRWMALSNPLVFYGILKAVTLLMPDSAFWLAFTNGFMSRLGNAELGGGLNDFKLLIYLASLNFPGIRSPPVHYGFSSALFYQFHLQFRFQFHCALASRKNSQILFSITLSHSGQSNRLILLHYSVTYIFL